MKGISILCPSRGRPERFRAMVESALTLAADPAHVRIHLILDLDEPRFEEYVHAAELGQVALHVSREKRSVPALLEWVVKSAPMADIVMCGADDVLFRTQDWDDKVRGALGRYPDGLAVGYPNDGRDREKLEFWAVSRAWIETVGYFAWPDYEHFSADEHVERIAQRCGRLMWMKDVVTEHMHFKYGKAQRDATYAAKRGVGPDGKSMSERDAARLEALAPEVDRAVVAVQLAIARASRKAA